jgi:hypothetical protein
VARTPDIVRCEQCARVLAKVQEGVLIHKAAGFSCRPVGPMVCRCGAVTLLPDLSATTTAGLP